MGTAGGSTWVVTSDGMRRSFEAPPAPAPPSRRAPLSNRRRFLIAGAGATAWTALATWLSIPGIDDLAGHVGLVAALLILGLVAWIPGLLVAFLLVGQLLDHPRLPIDLHPTAAVTVLLAVRDEEATVGATLDYLAAQDYEGELRVVLVDNGSSDATVIEALKAAGRTGLGLSVLTERRPGRNQALNRGLAAVQAPVVVTVDAGTLLQRSAVRMLVARLVASPEDVAAVPGNLMVRNSRDGLWARLQVWDYLLGVAAVNRVQGLFQGTLFAQRAFSAYRTAALRRVGGWPTAEGEDALLTWRLLLGGRVFHEPLAVGFTDVPTTLPGLARQRARWARSLLEGVRAVPPWFPWQWTTRVLAGLDLVVPLLDLAYVAGWLPGLALAASGFFGVAEPMVVSVVWLSVALNLLLFRRQKRRVLEPLGLRPRRDALGFVLFLLGYQPMLSVLAVRGYAQHLLHRRPAWH